jgi:formylglycine-generating enzyme required for sulfatase activity
MAIDAYRLLVEGSPNAAGTPTFIRQGTGWFIAHDLVVTAFHVVGHRDQGAWWHEATGVVSDIRYWLELAPGRRVELIAARGNSEADVASLRLTEPVEGARVLRPCPDEVRRHDDWSAPGYPADEGGRPFTLDGHLSEVGRPDPSEELQLLVEQGTEHCWEGCSGSPLRDADDRFLGLLTKVHEVASTGTAYAAGREAVLGLLGDDADSPGARYASAVRDRVDVLPQAFAEFGGPRTLHEVYVEVEITAEGRLDSHEDSPFAPPGKAHGRRSGVSTSSAGVALPGGAFKLRAVLDLPGSRWLLSGAPGSGKSVLLHQLALDLLSGESPWLPLPLKVAELLDGAGRPRSVLEAVEESYEPDVLDPVRAALRGRRAVLLLDGFDEVLDPAVAGEAVARAARKHRWCPLIMTSRPTEQARLAGFVPLVVCPLGSTQQRQLLTAWLGDGPRAERELARMRLRPRLRRLVENPLLLTLSGLVLLVERTMPSGRAQLYELALDHLLRRNLDRTPSDRRLPDDRIDPARRGLSRLALALHGEQQDLFERDRVSSVLVRDPAWEHLKGRWQTPESFLADVARCTGLLVPDRHSETLRGCYHFPHRTFREYLAALALAVEIADAGVGGSAGLERVLTDARTRPAAWTEVLALTCGLLRDGRLERGPDLLVDRVVEVGGPELARRVVAEAEGITEVTLFKVLAMEQGRENWKERRDLILDLPAAVGELGVVAALAEKIASKTTHGADLFSCRELLVRIAAGWEEGAVDGSDLEVIRRQALEAARGVLAAHRPAGRRIALQRVDACMVEIPGGTFSMGSPEDEDGRWDDEGLVHEVTLAESFEMMSVPVTNGLYELFDPGHEAERAFSDPGGPWGTAPAGELPEHPVVNVSWWEAAAFAAWLGCELPTEARWERAARAGTRTRYSFGDDEGRLGEHAWFDRNSDMRTHKVGELSPNEWGLYDMAGNTWEWCVDHWRDDYGDDEDGVDDPCHQVAAGEADAVSRGVDNEEPPVDMAPEFVDKEGRLVDTRGRPRVVRGGSWIDVAGRLRCAARSRAEPRSRYGNLGFRLVRRLFREHAD